MRPSNNFEKEVPADMYWRDDRMDVKVEALNSLKAPVVYNQDQMPSTN